MLKRIYLLISFAIFSFVIYTGVNKIFGYILVKNNGSTSLDEQFSATLKLSLLSEAVHFIITILIAVIGYSYFNKAERRIKYSDFRAGFIYALWACMILGLFYASLFIFYLSK